LLEVILALIILAIFATVTLQIRLEGLRTGRAVAESQRAQRLLSDVLDLAQARMLPDPRTERDDRGEIARIIWEGQREGVRFTCIQDEADVSAPDIARSAPAADARASTVRVRRLTARAAGETAVLYLPLAPRS